MKQFNTTFSGFIKKPLFIFLFCILIQISAHPQVINFSSIPKSGTILVYTHQDDDLIWMLPWWNISEKFIGAAMPASPRFREIVHNQQLYMNNNGYNINYESNWIHPWGDVENTEYQYYYWNRDPDYSYLENDHVIAQWNESNTEIATRELNKIKSKIEQYIASPDVSRIITHNNWGEYGHVQHRAVNKAVRELAVKYRKDVWMLGCDNGNFEDITVPSGLTFTLGTYDGGLFDAIRELYIHPNDFWTWSTTYTPSGSHEYVKIVDSGNDLSNILTGESVTVPGASQYESGAYIFDGTDDYMTLAGNSNTSFTIAMRVRPDEIKAMDISKMTEYPLSTTYDRSFNLQSNGRVTAQIFDGQSRTVTSTTALSAGKWTHILMTGNESTLKIYINGLPEGTIYAGSAISSYATPEFVLGQAQETASFFKGQISDVRLYDYVLTDSEIASLFSGSSPTSYTITSSASTGGTISPDGLSTFNPGTSQTYTIASNSGYQVSDVKVDNVSVGVVSTYTFNNIAANHTIAVTFASLSASIALNKPTTCQSNQTGRESSKANDTDGTNSSFWSADPYSKWWQVDLGNMYDVTSIVVRNYVDGVRYYQYNVQASTDNVNFTNIAQKTNTSIALDEGDTYTLNTTARYLRVNMTYNSANTGVHISDFRAYGTLSGGTVTYTINANAGAGGIISPSGTTTVNQGGVQAFTISPDNGYLVSDVLVDNVSVGAVSVYTFSNVSANHTIAASFTALPTYTITGSAGNGGTISPSGAVTVIQGSSKSFNISPNSGYKISDVLVDSVSVGAVSAFTFNNVIANHSIAVKFTAVPTFTITGSAGAGGTISPMGAVTVNQGAVQAFTITPNSGYQVSGVLVDSVSVGAVSIYTFNNVTANHSIAVTFTIIPVTYTITASAGAGGTISPSGTAVVNQGAAQSFSFAPNTGYQISDVLVDNVSMGALFAYTFNNVMANHSISVVFASLSSSIALNKPTTCQSYQTGKESSKANDTDGTNNSYWSADPYTKWWQVDLGSSYNITSLVIRNYVGGSRYYQYNIQASTDNITFTKIAEKTNTSAATDAGDSYTVNTTARYLKVNMTYNSVNTGVHISDFRAYGTLSGGLYSINAGAGAGGTISPSGTNTVIQGAAQAYTITPNSGYRISDVLVDNVSVGTLSSYTFSNVNANHTIAATFAALPTYTITGIAGTGGTVSPAGAVTVNQGATQVFTITPNTGYRISDVLVDNVSVGTISSYTFNNISSNHTIAATFAALPTFTITGSTGTGGTISPSGTVTVNQGATQAFTITPSSGYQISDVLVDSVTVGAISSYTFNNVTANHIISAAYVALPTYTITGSAGMGGTISPNGNATVIKGGTQAFTITANSGYRISDVLVDNVSVGAVSSYTFNNVSANHTIAVTFVVLPTTFTITGSAGTGGTISPSGVITVNQGATQAFTIASNSGYLVSDVMVDNVSVGALSAYTFNNVTANHTISVVFASLSNSIALDKPTTCQSNQIGKESSKANDSDGTNSSFWSADPYSEWWQVDLGNNYKINSLVIRNYVGGSRYYQYNVQASTDNITFTKIAEKTNTNPATDAGDSYTLNVVARYLKVNMTYNSANTGVHISDFRVYGTISTGTGTYSINASAGTGGAISPSGLTTVNKGADQTFTITPTSGYQISNVLVDNISVGALTSYTFSNVSANHTISASFSTQPTYSITGSAGAGGAISPSGIVTVNQGGTQTFNITPNSGYTVSDVLVDNVSVGVVSAYTFNNVSANHIIAATFAAQPTYTITGTAGMGGAISPSGAVTVNQGATRAFTIAPNSGYQISDVVVDNISVGAVTAYTFYSVSVNHTISATFSALPTYTITGSAGTGGTISPSGVSTVIKGASQSFTIAANSGYQISDVMVDNVSLGVVSSYTFNNVTASHTISATFATLPTYTITGSAGTGGTISPSGVSTVIKGAAQSFSIAANSGYQISDVTVDNISVGVVSSYTFNNVSANHTITATFAVVLNTYTISGSASAGGIISPSGATTVNQGAAQSYAFTPNSGYQVSDVQVDNVSMGASSSYTFNNIMANHTIAVVFTSLSTSIALDKPTTCQSNQIGKESSKANDSDGSNYSYWSADPYSQWWQVDLGNNYNVTSIVVRNYVGGSRYYQYNVQASTDNITFTKIAEKTNTNAATDAGDSYTVNTNARYLRVNMTYNSANTGVHISDFRAYGTVSGLKSTYNTDNLMSFGQNSIIDSLAQDFIDKTTTLKVYPNPFSDGFYVRMDSPDENLYNISITDLSGRTVFSGEKVPGNAETRFNVNLSRGIYLLRLDSRGTQKIIRIMKY